MPSERVQRRIDALLDDTDAAIAAGNWDLALQKSHDVLAFNPEDPDAQAAQRRLAEDNSHPVADPEVVGEPIEGRPDSAAAVKPANTGSEGIESILMV